MRARSRITRRRSRLPSGHRHDKGGLPGTVSLCRGKPRLDPLHPGETPWLPQGLELMLQLRQLSYLCSRMTGRWMPGRVR